MTKSGYYRVGLFTFAGVALLAALLVVLGSGALFKDYLYVETYFEQSVQGLSVGSPFLYRGVRLGSVAEIGLCRDKYGGEFTSTSGLPGEYGWVYVLLQVEPRMEGPSGRSKEGMAEELRSMVDRGFRVRLSSQGITGLSVIQGDYLDEEKYPVPEFEWEPRRPFVPSAPSTLVRVEEAVLSISDSLTKIDFTSIGEALDRTVTSIDTMVRQLDPGQTGETLRVTLEDIQAIVADAREVVEGLDPQRVVADFEASSASVREVAARAESIAADVEPVVERLLPEIKEAAAAFTSAVEEVERMATAEELGRAIESLPSLVAQLDRTLRRADLMLAGGSEDVDSILGNLRLAASNLRDLSDLAREYPSQVLFGEAPSRARLPRTERATPRGDAEARESTEPKE